MPDELFNRGLSLAQGGHFQQAEQCLQAALLFNSRDLEAVLLLAEVQALQGHVEAATATLKRAQEKGTSDSHLGKAMTSLGEILKGTHADMPQTVTAERRSHSTKQRPKSASTRRKRKRKKKRR